MKICLFQFWILLAAFAGIIACSSCIETGKSKDPSELLKRLALSDSLPEQLDLIVQLAEAGSGGSVADSVLQVFAAQPVEKSLVRGYHYFWNQPYPGPGSATGEEGLLRDYAVWAIDRIILNHRYYEPVTYHVNQDHPAADDKGEGTVMQPFKTIGRAVLEAMAGDTIMIHNGVYREWVRPLREGIPGKPIVYIAAPGEKPVVSATDPWNVTWRSDSEGIWVTNYKPHPWDTLPMTTLCCEQIFVNDQLLLYYPDFSDFKKNSNSIFKEYDTLSGSYRLWIHLPDKADPNRSTIERSMRQQCFAPLVRGLGHIHVIGLTMKGGAAPRWHGSNWQAMGQRAVLSVNNGHHWLIKDNTVEWGNAQGIQVAGGGFSIDLKSVPAIWPENEEGKSYVFGWRPALGRAEWEELPVELQRHNIIMNNVIRDHGIAGIIAIGLATNIVMEGNEISGNCRIPQNRRTAEQSGIKIHGMEHVIMRNNYIHDNYCKGAWIESGSHHVRFTGNIMVNNAQTRIMEENCPGPLLIDNNVIIDKNPEDTKGVGFYVHTGNRATLANNFFYGQGTIVRTRALFHWMMDGKPSTTSDHRIFNNILANPLEEMIRLMPEVSRCERNRANHNIYWNHGRSILNTVENNNDVGLQWETTETGRKNGWTGGGTRNLDLQDWSGFYDHDNDNLMISPELLFQDLDPEKIRDVLKSVWTRRGLPLDGGYMNIDPVPVHTFLYLLQPQTTGFKLKHQVRLSPVSGIQVWENGEVFRMTRWQDNQMEILVDPPGVVNPVSVIQDDEKELLIPGQQVAITDAGAGNVIFGGLETGEMDEKIMVRVPEETLPGKYKIVIQDGTDWQLYTYRVVSPFELVAIKERKTGENGIGLTIRNSLTRKVEATAEIQLGKDHVDKEFILPPGSLEEYILPVAYSGAGEMELRLEIEGTVIEQKKLVSFATAPRADSWEEAPHQDMDNFPGGLFPEGAFDYEFYKGNLHAGWQARYDNNALYVRVNVFDRYHINTSSDIEATHANDGVKIALKGKPGARGVIINMGIRSDNGEKVIGFHRTADEEKYPIGLFPGLDADIQRDEVNLTTTYEVKILWDMIGLAGPPAEGSYIPYSVAVYCKDPSGRYGLQWFFGINYNEKEGKEEHMGKLWFE